MTYTVWEAYEDELESVMDLLHKRVKWLHDSGNDQWSTWPRWEPEITESIHYGRTYLLRDHADVPTGTIAFSHEGDPDFWTPDELNVPALYPSKLATDPDIAPKGTGRLLLDFTMYVARMRHLQEVRLDVWKTAQQLHHYYLELGWTYLRTEHRPKRYSGALFTKHVDLSATNMPPADLELRPPRNRPCADPVLL